MRRASLLPFRCSTASGGSVNATHFSAPSFIRALSLNDENLAAKAAGAAPSFFAVITEDKRLLTYGAPPASSGSSGDASAAACPQLGDRTLEKRGIAMTRMVLPSAGSGSSSAAGAAAAGAGAAEPQHLLIAADKFGDVTAFPDPAVGARKRMLLGHTGSIVTALAGSVDGKFLLSADREERIRVSHFPATYLVAGFCLGHTRFVTGMHLLRRPLPLPACAVTAPSPAASAAGAGGEAAVSVRPASYAVGEVLVSAGADGTLRAWHWRSSTLLHSLYLTAGEDVHYPGDVALPRTAATPGATAAAAAAGSSASAAGVVDGGEDGSAAVVGADGLCAPSARYGAVASAGAHVDASMNRTENTDAAPGDGSAEVAAAAAADGVAAPVDEDADEDADGAVAGDSGSGAGAAAGAGAGAGAGGKSSGAAAGSTSSAAAPGVIPKAWAAGASARHSTPPLLPGPVSECPRTGLLATIVDGEHAVRLVTLAAPAGQCDHVPVPRSNDPADDLLGLCSPELQPAVPATGRTLPQVQLQQVSVLRLPFRPLTAQFLEPPAGADAAGGSAAASAFLLLAEFKPSAAIAAAGASSGAAGGAAAPAAATLASDIKGFTLAVFELAPAAGSSGDGWRSRRLPDAEVAARFPLVASVSAGLASVPLSASVRPAPLQGGSKPAADPGAGVAAAEALAALRSNQFAASLEEYDKHWAAYHPRDPADAQKKKKARKGEGEE